MTDPEGRAQANLDAFQRVLVRIARGEPRDQTLVEVCLDVEQRYPGSRCTVLVVDHRDHTLHCAAGPSMPPAYTAAIEGLPIAQGMGACGTAAATGETVVVADTHTDPLTEAFVELAVAHDLRSVWSFPLVDGSGRVVGTFALYRSDVHTPTEAEVESITAAAGLAELAIERSEAERALTDLAQRDAVTGLPSRASFLDRLTEMLADATLQTAVMFLDVDRFKWINDSLGHPAGDRVLVDVAKRLREILDERHFLARFGGDEFTVAVPAATPFRIADAAARIEAAFAEPFRLDGGEFFLSASVGVAVNDHPADAFELVRDADAAMYVAKEQGRARYVMFDGDMRQRAVARVTRETELRRGMERDQLVLHYQPIWNPATEQWDGLEALARWEHPRLGLLSPAEFIPLAEDTGLIVPLGAYLLDRALHDLSHNGLARRGLRVGVNVSVLQLADPHFPRAVQSMLAHHGIRPGQLFLEVTESGLMEHLDVAQRGLRAIAASGVEVVVDDFGTGYSSIARLGDLPVSGVKVDRAFTKDLGRTPRADRVMSAITALAHAHDLSVVAEGIETGLALDRVAALQVAGVQGYYLARPTPLADLDAVLVPRSTESFASMNQPA